ncbi:MAG TPA: hypothetical protein VMJ31_00030, partial [Methylocystis sp.]|nr:hypothetical protein [Methylocystis sp.]
GDWGVVGVVEGGTQRGETNRLLLSCNEKSFAPRGPLSLKFVARLKFPLALEMEPATWAT